MASGHCDSVGFGNTRGGTAKIKNRIRLVSFKSGGIPRTRGSHSDTLEPSFLNTRAPRSEEVDGTGSLSDVRTFLGKSINASRNATDTQCDLAAEVNGNDRILRMVVERDASANINRCCFFAPRY